MVRVLAVGLLCLSFLLVASGEYRDIDLESDDELTELLPEGMGRIVDKRVKSSKARSALVPDAPTKPSEESSEVSLKEHSNTSSRRERTHPECAAVWYNDACESKGWWEKECHKCGDRIKHMMQVLNDENAAHNQVAQQFPKECGACDKRECAEVWDLYACDKGGCWTCGQRIKHLQTEGKTEQEAGIVVAHEFPEKCLPCQKKPASGSLGPPPTPAPGPSSNAACTAVWFKKACESKGWWSDECFTCGERIMWAKENYRMTDEQAGNHIAAQFPDPCAPCDSRFCKDVWDIYACDKKGGCWSCGQRIEHLKTSEGKSEHEAAVTVAHEFPDKCGPCQKAPQGTPPPAPRPTPAPSRPTPSPGPEIAPSPSPLPSTGPTPSTAPNSGGDYKLMSYNVLYNNHRYWDIAGVIKHEVDPDIVNLQEAINNMPNEIVDKLNNVGGEWKLANPWSSGHYWCGLTAYRSDKWDVVWHKEQGIRQDGDTRGLCGALLKRKSDGTQLCVFGMHPVWRSGGTDHWAKDIIRKGAGLMKECSAKGAPSSLFCDCNTHDHNSVRGQLEATTGQKWKAAVHDGYDMIFVEERPDAVGITHGAGAISPKAGQRGCKTGCAQKAWGYSDHPPVYVEVKPR